MLKITLLTNKNNDRIAFNIADDDGEEGDQCQWSDCCCSIERRWSEEIKNKEFYECLEFCLFSGHAAANSSPIPFFRSFVAVAAVRSFESFEWNADCPVFSFFFTLFFLEVCV